MKYSDEQRIARIKEIVDKLNHYIQDSGISRDTVLSDETVRWTLVSCKDNYED